MKKIILIILLLSIGFFNSCQKDFLESESPSSLDEAVIFSNASLAEDAVNGIKIPFGDTNSYRGRWLLWYGFNTDTECYANYTESNPPGVNEDLCNYDAKPDNSVMNTPNNVWNSMYTGIERANICIRGIRRYGNPAPGNDLGYLLGEALTLRAVYYADLLKTWGDVPARFEPTLPESVNVPKTSRDIIYKQIIADLGEAAGLVPWPNSSAATSSVERINKAFVKGLRARLALAASGYQQYPDGVRRSTDPELSVANMYQLALSECQDIIASNKASLVPSFETFWKDYNKEYLAAGKESLWEIPFEDGRGRMLIQFAVPHSSADQFQTIGKGGQCGPLPTVFYDYDQADTRRDVTCVPYYYGSAINGIAKQELTPPSGTGGASIKKWYFGKYRFEWMTRIVANPNDDGLNKIYMRYAEVLLMAAEAENELNGPTALAAGYLKQIRRRAFKPEDHAVKVDAYVDALTSKTAMFNAIVEEHKFEFTGEMLRKQALIRWNLLKTNLDLAKTKMYNLQDRTGEYVDVPVNLYWKYKTSDPTQLDIYGLNRGESTPQLAPYNEKAWNSVFNTRIERIYKIGTNPDDRQFWPIWKYFIDNSNGLLINDYGY
jgi:hypothetical protein